MSSREAKITSDILLTLSEKIPDELLYKCFPDMKPGDVKSFLWEAAQKLSAGAEARRQYQADTPVVSHTSKVTKLTLYTDGASRGNPGEAGAGIWLLDEKKQEIAAKGFYLGRCTNNVAEYRALILGLTHALQFGNQEITVYLDSELIVRQIKGEYRVKNVKLIPLYSEVVMLLADFKVYSVNYVPRLANARADQLANQGIDNKS